MNRYGSERDLTAAVRAPGLGSSAIFLCGACSRPKSTAGRKLAPVLGLKTWVCAACMGEREAKSEAREQQQLRAGLCHHEERAK